MSKILFDLAAESWYACYGLLNTDRLIRPRARDGINL